jgi:hypothetical protein
MTFKIGDMVELKSANIFGIIIEEDRRTKRYKIKWLSHMIKGESWASYDRIEKVS